MEQEQGELSMLRFGGVVGFRVSGFRVLGLRDRQRLISSMPSSRIVGIPSENLSQKAFATRA